MARSYLADISGSETRLVFSKNGTAARTVSFQNMQTHFAGRSLEIGGMKSKLFRYLCFKILDLYGFNVTTRRARWLYKTASLSDAVS